MHGSPKGLRHRSHVLYLPAIMSSVARHFEELLKHLIAVAPPGFLLDSPWLAQHGVSRQLAHHYARRGWLERVAHGVYRLPQPLGASTSPAADWAVPLLSAQWLGYDVHVGGPTALSLQGYTHFLPFGDVEVAYLYAADPPSWLKRLALRSELRRRSKKLFAEPDVGLERTGPSGQGASLNPWEQPVTLSTPERAILEALDELPRNEGFGTVDAAFECLTNLRPRLVTTLLENCRSVKVKRLFFVYAEQHSHAWRKHLEAEAFDLGSGDRALTPGGRLHPRYRITVPDYLLPNEDTSPELAGPDRIVT